MTKEQIKRLEIENEVLKEQLSMYVVSDKLLSVPYLIGLHNELTIKEALSLCKFCKYHTITHKECYGIGQIMYPKWLAEKAITS
jgi:hypothetical protein